MAAKTAIQWTNATWNPWYGCRKVSAGCANCYAERWADRTGRDFSQVTRAADATFYAPLKWREPRLVFVCSLGDFFFDGAEIDCDMMEWHNQHVLDTWREDAYNVMRQASQHTYLILTKRPDNIIPPGKMTSTLPEDWGDGWPNVWLGVTVESADYVRRAEMLAGVPVYGNQRFVSYEPAIGSLYDPAPRRLKLQSIGWFIAGGESGTGARLARPQWFEEIRADCSYAGVPFFLKQLGGQRKVDGAYGGYTLPDGSQPREVPAELQRFFEE